MNLRKLLRIARWEVSTATGGIDRRTAIVGLIGLVLAGGVAGAAAAGFASPPNDDLYAVGVSSDSPFHEPVASATPLQPVEPTDERAVVRIGDANVSDRRAEVTFRDTQKGRAALSAVRDAIQRYNTGLMAAESNQSAAFPVSVTLTYVTRADAAGLGQTDTAPTTETPTPDATDTAAGGSETTTDRQTPTPEEGIAVPDVGGGGGGLFGGRSTGSPAEISPPFPFGSLVLAFVFLVPMNFLIQAYGSSILGERINRRGEPMLVAPVSRGTIVAGKTLPYLALAVLVTVAIALGVSQLSGSETGAGLLTVAAVVPIALVFLGATFLGAMFARSFKELTFLTVTVSVGLTTYVFVPAIFTTITPVALISPLTLVVRDLQPSGAVTTLGEYLFSTGPFYLASTVLFLLGTGVYREEDMFTQRSVPAKLLDALNARLSGLRSVAVLSAALVPFVFVAELLGIALLIALPQQLAVPALLVVVAVVEETAKSLHVFAGFQRRRFEPRLRVGVVVGAVSGVGFFLAEKATAVVQVVGLDRLPLGQAAFAPSIGGGGITLAAALVAPLALHVVTTAIASVGAVRGRRAYLVTLVAAMAIHFAYDLIVVVVLLG